MEFHIHRENLRRALSYVDRVVGKHATLPILNNVVLRARTGILSVVGTNLELGITAKIGARVEQEGELAVPGKVLSECIQSLVGEVIHCSQKNTTLTITSDGAKVHILGFETKEYPIIPQVTGEVLFRVEAATFASVLESVSDAASVMETRPELAGVFIHVTEQELVCAATDSFRLAEGRVVVSGRTSTQFIVPRAAVVEMIRVMVHHNGVAMCTISEHQISISTDEAEIVSRLVDGHYPEYQRVIPERFTSQALVDVGLLDQNIKLAGLFSSTIADVVITSKDNSIVLEAKNSERGEVQTEVPAVIQGPSFTMAVNFRFLLDSLRHLNQDKVVIGFAGPTSPLVIRPATDSQYTYLIMPLRR